MAELPVLATEQPEYREIVERYEVGVCVDPDRPGAYREGFERIVASYRRFKENSRRAKMVLNWEQEEHALLQFYEKLAQEASLRNVAGGVG
jgi:glycosyltransferase involved in cell wall biosynthesis